MRHFKVLVFSENSLARFPAGSTPSAVKYCLVLEQMKIGVYLQEYRKRREFSRVSVEGLARVHTNLSVLEKLNLAFEDHGVPRAAH